MEPEDNDPQPSCSYQTSGNQQSTDYSKVDVRLEEFIKYFVKEFEAKLLAYHLILEGKTEKAGKLSDGFAAKIGQVVGGAAGGLAGLIVGAPVAVAKLGATAGKEGGKELGSKIGSEYHKNKAVSLSDLVYYSQKNKSNFRQVLVEAGFDVFQSFEMQFMRVTTDQGPKKAMQLLARDAVNRAISYYTQQKDSLITEGVVLGKSKVEPVWGILPIASSRIKTPGFKIIYKYKSSEEKWISASLYEKVGLVITEKEPPNYYEKKDVESKTDKYGYRRLFTSEDWNKLIDKYKPSDVAKSGKITDYQYTLNSKDLEQKSRDILKKINQDDEALVELRIMNIIEEVKDDIIELVNVLKKHSAGHEKDRKILVNMEANLKNLKVDGYLEKFQQNFEAAKMERRKIAEDTKKMLNQLSQKQDAHHDVNKREHKETHERLDTLGNKIDAITPSQRDQNKDPVWHNMSASVKSFTGRESELLVLHEKLQKENKQVVVISQTIAITGLGGVGKSELARKYAYKYKEYYNDNVIWIIAESIEDLIKSFQDLATELNIPLLKKPHTCEIDMESTVRSIYKYFKDTNSLFIFDNVDEYEYKDIKMFLPYSLHPDSKKPHILITSRNQDWEVGEEGKIEVVKLGDFSLEEAVQFIKKALDIEVEDKSRDKEINQLAEALQYFPLALRQATSYITVTRAESKFRGIKKFGIIDYLKEYKEEAKKTSLLNFEPKHGNDRYMKTIITTWKTTLNNIEQREDTGKQALAIMDIIAYLAPDKIPVERLFLKLVGDEEQLWSAVKLLNKYSMISLNEGIAAVHRLVQEVTRLEINGQRKEEEVLRKALELIKSLDLADDDPRESHIVSIWNYASQYNQLIKNFYSICDRYRNTPLHFLAKSGNKEAIVRILTSQHVSEGSSDLMKYNYYNNSCDAPVHIAAKNGHLEIVKYYIEKQNVVAKLGSRHNLIHALIMPAITYGKLNIVQYLVESEYDKDVSIPDDDGWYPIHLALVSNNPDLVQFLIKKGANLDVLWHSKTPLQLALYPLFKDNNYEVVDVLLESDPKLIHHINLGMMPLHQAVKYGLEKCTKTLLRRGADVNVKTIKIIALQKKFSLMENACAPGLTSLHIAALQGFLKIAKLLLGYGAIYNAIDEQGSTPYDKAKPGSDIKEFLNYIDQLFQAVKHGRKEDVNSLLEGKDFNTLNAALNARNTDDQTLLYIAIANRQKYIAELLVEKFNAVQSSGQQLTSVHHRRRSFQLVLPRPVFKTYYTCYRQCTEINTNRRYSL